MNQLEAASWVNIKNTFDLSEDVRGKKGGGYIWPREVEKPSWRF